ncbi:YqaA family protein [Aggregatibacter actinomycetemcomitans]|uniref:YqaA family protein n=1 Tax=Aggregatibacter actinomycetemcomitans TaxID=714 RepID=UPI00197C3031|nr:YqaA family protein [Aggregatibacter actinomycetemcomitans]MBN6064391.1 DedA family protein [Aggregatibacter actinomycetemcomitans]MBN6082136.1 DedA family protein [Aggregatibacter actinomycetemcomitans]MBN6084328.1 DedA family protein [Aggregatibacter actinomycetemcomitans]
MFDLFSWDWWQSLFGEHLLWIMFTSAFLSSTVLPGNSEIIFLTIAAPLLWSGSDYFSMDIQGLLWVAVIGNTLGSLTTYVLGRWLPAFNKPPQNTGLAWALEKTQRYGSLVLFFSWLPIIGDVFCAVAGWLRLNWAACLIFIALGKIVRYVFLLFLGVAFL